MYATLKFNGKGFIDRTEIKQPNVMELECRPPLGAQRFIETFLRRKSQRHELVVRLTQPPQQTLFTVEKHIVGNFI